MQQTYIHSCSNVALLHKCSVGNLSQWNPSLSSDNCSWKLSGPTQSGIPSTRDKRVIKTDGVYCQIWQIMLVFHSNSWSIGIWPWPIDNDYRGLSRNMPTVSFVIMDRVWKIDCLCDIFPCAVAEHRKLLRERDPLSPASLLHDLDQATIYNMI